MRPHGQGFYNAWRAYPRRAWLCITRTFRPGYFPVRPDPVIDPRRRRPGRRMV